MDLAAIITLGLTIIGMLIGGWWDLRRMVKKVIVEQVVIRNNHLEHIYSELQEIRSYIFKDKEQK